MYRARGDKRLRRATFGTYPSLTLADARDLARADLHAAAKGRDPAEERKSAREADTFGELASQYLEKYAKKQKRSWFKDQQALNRDLLPRFRHRKAAKIRRREVIALLEEIADRGAPVGANRTLEIMRRIYNWGIEREIIDLNPCQRIKKIGVERRRERVLNDEELRAVWAAFEQETPRMCAHFKLRLLTLQRGGEISRMRWKDLDSSSCLWTIPPEFTKNGLSHRVPLSSLTMQIIEDMKGQLDGSEWVFPSPTGKGPLRVFWRAIAAIKEHSKVEFVPHDLRRTGASRLTGDLEFSRFLVGQVLNHVETGVTATYDRHAYDREKRHALDAWGQRLTEIVSGECASANVVSLATRSELTY
jgi:integrase